MNPVALIPCRQGSKRIPEKNFKPLGHKPLLVYTVEAAQASGLFDEILLCTDAPERAWEVLRGYATESVGVLEQPMPLHRDDCSDLEWITDVLGQLRKKDHRQGSLCGPCSLGANHQSVQSFMLLRPTSPFRGPETIKKAWAQWEGSREHLDSLRAVRKSTEPAWKQWLGPARASGLEHVEMMFPVVAGRHWHSQPTQSLPQCYVQTAALEVFWGKTILDGTLSGERVGMFLTERAEALDVNTLEDWSRAEEFLERHES